MAALGTTTLGQALSADAETVYLASGTGVSVGTLLFSGAEAMTVTKAITSTAFKVQRGAAATTAAAHASGATVYRGAPSQFYADDPVGVPVSDPPVTPWINLVNGTIWSVSGDAWVVATATGAISATTVTAEDVTASDAIEAATIEGTTSVDSALYKVGGVDGADSGGSLTSITAITVVNGIVTEITGT